MLSITTSVMLIPNSSAHDPPWTVPTSAYVSLAPTTIGLGQSTTIVVWLDRYSPTGNGLEGQFWDGFLLTITQPDGTNTTIGPWTCGSTVASDFKVYTPTAIGTYKIVFSWPGETVTEGVGAGLSRSFSALGDFYEGSTSEPAYLTVQQDPVPTWPESPLPNDFWTRPINGANRAWASLPSNWLRGTWNVNNFQPQGTAPNTAHILWQNPITPGRAGGLADASWFSIPADVSDYENPWSSPIIMNGFIYYNTPTVGDSANYGYYCVNLYTGQQVWYKNGTDNGLENPVAYTTGSFGGNAPSLAQSYPQLTLGQMKYYFSVNGQGVLSYLWMQQGSTWYMLDAATGNWMLTLKNVPSGTAATDQDGNLLIYSYNPTTGNILCWNSSKAIYPGGLTGTGEQQWKPRMGGVIDAVNDTSWQAGASLWSGVEDAPTWLSIPHSGYTMNVTGPKNLPASVAFGASASGFTRILQDDQRVPKELFGFYKGSGSSIGSSPDPDQFSVWALQINEHATDYSPFPGQTPVVQTNLGFTVTQVLDKTITVPLPGKNYTWNLGDASYQDQVFTLRCSQTSQIWGYSLETGNLLWGPIQPFNQMDFYGLSSSMYYGKVLICSSYGGTLAAYDAQTGDFLWVYNATATYPYESNYGANMPLSVGAVADGKVYLYSSEHSPTKPLWRESYLRCVNITDGQELWKLLDFNMGLGIADGYAVTASIYDNMVYAIGKGPSATTVEAPRGGILEGNSFTITGTVTDQSPGAVAYAAKYGLVNGLAAVSDDSQEGFMEYIYMQQVKPTSTTGVPVTINVIDPNDNSVTLGETTSDASGFYSFQVNPDMLTAGAGTYTVIASFAGSGSYGSSSAESAFTINSSPTSTTAPTSGSTQQPTEMYILAVGIAIIIAIAIVGAILLSAIRKRP
jgi:hypothetical protein